MSRERKRPKDAPTHVVSWPLRATAGQRSVIETRFRAAPRAYNACLREALRRSRAMKCDPAYGTTKARPGGKARTAAFKEIDRSHGCTKSALMSYGSALRRSWVREQVLSQEAQVLAARAFGTSRRWHLGLAGKPRLKAVGRGLHSLECKDRNGSMKAEVEDGRLVGLQWCKGLRHTRGEGPDEGPAQRARSYRAARGGREGPILPDNPYRGRRKHHLPGAARDGRASATPSPGRDRAGESRPRPLRRRRRVAEPSLQREAGRRHRRSPGRAQAPTAQARPPAPDGSALVLR